MTSRRIGLVYVSAGLLLGTNWTNTDAQREIMHALTTTRHGQSDEWERKVRVCRRVLDRRRERLEVSSRGGWPVASYNVAAEAAELRRSRRRRQRCVCVWIFLKIAYAITVSEILRQRVGGWTTSVGVQRERETFLPPTDNGSRKERQKRASLSGGVTQSPEWDWVYLYGMIHSRGHFELRR